MKKIVLITILLSFSSFSQTNDSILKNLELKKQKLKMKIISLNDSIKELEIAISKINSEKSIQLLNDSVLEITIKKGGYIKDEASIFGKFIYTFKRQEKIIAFGYKNGYYNACFREICGFINEVWVFESNQKQNYLGRESKSSTNSINKGSTNTKYNYKRSRKSRYSSRTYYRGPRGGCYYINSNGNKTYVARSKCY